MMILLPGNTRQFKRAVRDNPEWWGWLITPRRTMRGLLDDIGGCWAADNECYALGDDFDPAVYVRMLESYADHNQSCLFATAEDRLGDAETTLNLFMKWAEIIHQIGLPVALVGQDGMEQLDIPWPLCDALFVGGSTNWKLGPGARQLIFKAKCRGKWVHVGRVNSAMRLEYCIKLGADSVDGTEWAINPGRGMRWASRVLERMSRQRRLL